MSINEVVPERNANDLTSSHVSTKGLPAIELSGIRVNAITERQCIEHVVEKSKAGLGGWVVTPNVSILQRCSVDSDARYLISKTSLAVPDGMPLIWASYLQRTPLPGRVPGSDLIYTLTRELANNNLSVYLLGGDPGTADRAAKALVAQNPALIIKGTYYPPFQFEHNPKELERIDEAVKAADPDVVYVALSFPKGEHLIEYLRNQYPRVWWIGVGVSFSFVSGDMKRAPVWMQRSGLEWMHRLTHRPKLMAKRYLVSGIPFALRLLAASAWRGIRNRGEYI